MSSVVVLDNHRLLCGDATDKGAVAELLDGAEIDLLLTDPPYGIDIVKVGGGNLVPLAEPSLRVSERERERAMEHLQGTNSNHQNHSRQGTVGVGARPGFHKRESKW